MSQWSAKKSFFWQQAPFFRLLLPLIPAIIAYDHHWLPHHLHPLPGLLVSCTCFILLAIPRRQAAWMKPAAFLLLQVTLFCLGWWLTREQDIRTKHNWFARNHTYAESYLVQVKDEPVEKERTWRMQLSICKALQGSVSQAVCGNAFLSIYKDSLPPPIHKGDLLLVPGDWSPVKNAGNPFEFDYVTFCRRRNILHQQFCSADKIFVYQEAGKNEYGFIERCHLFCATQLDKYITDTVAKGILQAMLLGDEGGFDPALRQAYAETGVVHIVSISGSHVGVLFFAITLLFFWLKGRKGQIVKYLAGLTAVWLYVLMAGAPPSALRAGVMFSIIALGTLTDKQSQPLNTLLAAAFVLLVANPVWLFTVGFQLSFCAVLSLMLFFRPIFLALPQTTAAGRWLWTAISASIAAEILTAPLSIYYFHNFPLFFVIANILAALLLGIIALIGGMCVIAFSWLSPVAAMIGMGITRMIRLFNYLIFHLQSWSPASFRYLYISAAELCLLYMIIALTALLLSRRRKQYLYPGMAFSCILLLSLSYHKYQSLRQHRLILYNSGKKPVIEEIRSNRYTLLNDASAVDYATNQAHIGWQAWHPAGKRLQPYFSFKGKNILLLNEQAIPDSTFPLPVDVLMLNQSLKKASARQLQRIFHPKILVASSLPSRWRLTQWKDSCKAIQQPFHTVAFDGAFVLE